MARRWQAHTPKGKDLPERVKKALQLIKHANGGEQEEDEPPPIPGKEVPRESLVSFFRNNPKAEDAQVHELAEAYRVDPHAMETQIYGILGDKLKTSADKIPGGKADDKPISQFDPAQIAKGKKVEMEHTDDPQLAKEIASDHLEEFGDYYTELDKMEERLKKMKAAA